MQLVYVYNSIRFNIYVYIVINKILNVYGNDKDNQ